MKLLLCCEHYFPSVGGVQEVMRQVAERLAARGHDVTVATGSHPARERIARVNGVTVVSFAVAGNQVRGMTGEVEAYRTFVLQHGYDALMIKAAQQWTCDALLPVLDRLSGRKIFIPCGFSALHDPAYAEYFRQMPDWMRRFDGLIFYATDYRDIRFSREHGLDQCFLLPNGADEGEFADLNPGELRQQLTIPEGDDLLLTVGSLNGAKGHWEVARAFELASLPRPATLVLNGHPPAVSALGRLARWRRAFLRGQWPSLDRLVQRINRLPGKRVVVTDLPRHSLVQAYKAADLFVFASHVEYSPLVLFEAAAAATPFLSVPAGNAAEIAEWTGAGTICPAPADAKGFLYPDPAKLGVAMARLLADPEKLAEAGGRGRAAFLERGFSWKAIAGRYEAILSGEAAA